MEEGAHKGMDKASSRISSPLSTVPSTNRPSFSVYVDVPRLSNEQKRDYVTTAQSTLKHAFLVDEIIGEHSEDSVLYYYARYEGGIAYKVTCFVYGLLAVDASILVCGTRIHLKTSSHSSGV